MSEVATQRDKEILLKYKKAQLQQLCKDYMDSNRAWNMNKPELVYKLLNCDNFDVSMLEQEGTEDTMKQLLHDIWFMRPLQKRHLRIGTFNEPKVLQELADFVFPAGIRVLRIDTFGLVCDPDQEYIATSVDVVLVFQLSDSSVVPVIAEVKTRYGSNAVSCIKAVAAQHGKVSRVSLPTTITSYMILFQTADTDSKFSTTLRGSRRRTSCTWRPRPLRSSTQCCSSLATLLSRPTVTACSPPSA